jgi:hypothetical protein
VAGFQIWRSVFSDALVDAAGESQDVVDEFLFWQWKIIAKAGKDLKGRQHILKGYEDRRRKNEASDGTTAGLINW